MWQEYHHAANNVSLINIMGTGRPGASGKSYTLRSLLAFLGSKSTLFYFVCDDGVDTECSD